MESIASKDVTNFVKENVIHRFRIPHTITTDGGSVFISEEFKTFTTDMGIKLIRSSPYYAQANGQAEASNQSLIKLIKRKIDEHPRRWHEVLSEALWAYRISCQGATKNFSLSPGVRIGGCITMGDYGQLETHRVSK
jgi:transposase InsO family protein